MLGAQCLVQECSTALATQGGGRKRGWELFSKKEISPSQRFPNCNNFPRANQGGARQTHQIRKVNTRRGKRRRRRRKAEPVETPPDTVREWGPGLSPCGPGEGAEGTV